MTQGNDGDGSIRSYVQFFRRRYRNRPAVADDRQSIAGGEQAVDIEVQVSPAAIGFTAITRLDRKPTVAGNRHIKIPSRVNLIAMGKVGARTLTESVRPGWKPVTEHGHAAKLLQIGQKARCIGIGQIVAVVGLSDHRLLGSTHGNVKHAIHMRLLRRV